MDALSKTVRRRCRSYNYERPKIQKEKSIVCSSPGTFHSLFPKEIDLNVFRFIGTNTGGETLQESAQIFSALISVNKFAHMYMDDDTRTLGWIKDLAKRFDCTDFDVARALRTRAGKYRAVLQLGLLQCCNDLASKDSTVLWLIENGADVNICTQERQNVVMLFLNQDDDCVPPLVSVNGEIEDSPQRGTVSPLLYRLITSPTLDLDHQDNTNNTALHYCLLQHSDQIFARIRLLLERGANPTIKNNDGKTPLDLAKEGKYEPEIIELLENAVADFKFKKN